MDIWIDGEILPDTKGAVSVQDESVRYGIGLFETLRIYKGKPFLLERHLKRMYQSAETLGFTPAFPEKVIIFAAGKLIHINRISEGILRIFFTPDHMWISTSPHITYKDKHYETGIHAMMAEMRRNETSPLANLKTLNYLENILAKRKASSLDFGEAIFLNTQGFIAEGTVSNIFLIKKGKLITPGLDQGILPGITRQAILELADKNNIPREEREVAIDELFAADECFLTNSLMEIMPLVMIDNIKIGRGNPGTITQILHQKYKEITQI